MGEAFIRFENVEKIYGSGEGAVRALHDASFTIGKGEICVIVGPSGAGKSTYLRSLNQLETITGGKIFIKGHLLLHREHDHTVERIAIQHTKYFTSICYLHGGSTCIRITCDNVLTQTLGSNHKLFS